MGSEAVGGFAAGHLLIRASKQACGAMLFDGGNPQNVNLPGL
jgi:hypothetical protein